MSCLDTFRTGTGPAENHPSTNPLRGRTLGGEVGAFEGFSETLSGIWSGFEHGGSPFSSRRRPSDHPSSFTARQPAAAAHARGHGYARLRQETQRNYLRSVWSFAAFLKRPPDTATPDDIRRFQLNQAESGVQPQSVN